VNNSFAQEGLGQILMQLSEFNQGAAQWLGDAIQDVELAGKISNDLSVSHGTSIFPIEGMPFLQVSSSVSINFGGLERLWWCILLNLSIDGEQTISARCRIEARHPTEYGPQDVCRIYQSSLPNGPEGVRMVEETCLKTFQHLQRTLQGKTAHEAFDNYRTESYSHHSSQYKSLKE
jgi:hypothetical protein